MDEVVRHEVGKYPMSLGVPTEITLSKGDEGLTGPIVIHYTTPDGGRTVEAMPIKGKIFLTGWLVPVSSLDASLMTVPPHEIYNTDPDA